MDHAQINSLTPCIGCHDGAVHDGLHVEGKDGNHLPTFGDCVKCHTVNAWSPNTAFDHAGIAGGCVSCHNGAHAPADGKDPARHLPTTNLCQACHAGTTTWTPLTAAQVDHAQVIGTCTTCHGSARVLDSLTTTIKPPGHLTTTSECSLCHSTQAWQPASGFDHTGIASGCASAGCHVDGKTTSPLGRGPNHLATSGNCQNCHAIGVAFTPHTTVDHAEFTTLHPCGACHDGGTHDGLRISGKKTVHIPTTADCDSCHVGAQNALTWLNGVFDHAGTNGGCAACHDGVHERGKTFNHIPTNADCVSCHAGAQNTLDWAGGSFSHAGIGSGCASCHDGAHPPADGKGPAHVASTPLCELCHTDSAASLSWTSTPALGQMDHTQLTSVSPCTRCHASSPGSALTVDGLVVTGRPVTTGGELHPASGDCASCHRTTGWDRVAFSHNGVSSNCAASGCHTDGNASPPRGRGPNHLATNTNCQDCHAIGGTFTPHRELPRRRRARRPRDRRQVRAPHPDQCRLRHLPCRRRDGTQLGRGHVRPQRHDKRLCRVPRRPALRRAWAIAPADDRSL
jgi:hypothetical protein